MPGEFGGQKPSLPSMLPAYREGAVLKPRAWPWELNTELDLFHLQALYNSAIMLH